MNDTFTNLLFVLFSFSNTQLNEEGNFVLGHETFMNLIVTSVKIRGYYSKHTLHTNLVKRNTNTTEKSNHLKKEGQRKIRIQIK